MNKSFAQAIASDLHAILSAGDIEKAKLNIGVLIGFAAQNENIDPFALYSMTQAVATMTTASELGQVLFDLTTHYLP